ncbi:hypothetical protein Hamer_G027966 [Homarus americanus]|uniref:Uncharacterized protein n=1 Tax=Homarus americanus TaxID=6706 RepID=A0A8J5MMT1_HOMAM|nr:hypothetical protein Hamer_G015831 [Homarus americanus]KAG7167318.1 hypothetical protein Hamer_G028903 [Homarus americanus]KAG7177778.1 hypothetical protein Hamer_G027966 [Homarus americanus]
MLFRRTLPTSRAVRERRHCEVFDSPCPLGGRYHLTCPVMGTRGGQQTRVYRIPVQGRLESNPIPCVCFSGELELLCTPVDHTPPYTTTDRLVDRAVMMSPMFSGQ